MGLLTNTCIFALMVLPLLLLVKGHRMVFKRLTALVAVIASCLLAESTLLASLAGMSPPLLQNLVTVVVVPIIDTALVNFILNDPKARKVLHIDDAGDDAAAVVATSWAAVDLVLFRWFRWYRVIGGLGFDAENLISAAEAFASLIAMLLAARRLDADGGSGPTLSAVAGVRVAAAAIGLTAGVPLLGHILHAALLVVLQLLFLPTLNNGRKED